MADATSASMLLNIGAIAAAARTSRYRNGGEGIIRDAKPDGNLNTARYMNYLRAPAPSIPPVIPSSNGGTGVHVHYQTSCAHGKPQNPLSLESHNPASYGECYARPPNRNISQGPHDAGCSDSVCGCSQCYWRDFLTHDIEKYQRTRQQLGETYAWNLHELLRRHRASPKKSRLEKDSELEKLYWYYVGRVREVYDNHCQHHRLLFQDVCLIWEMPEKVALSEDDLDPVPRDPPPLSRHSSTSFIPLDPTPHPRHESGSRWSLETTRINKGKEKEVVDTGDAGMQISVVNDDDDGDDNGEEREVKEREEEEEKEKETETKKETDTLPSRSNSTTTTDSKLKKLSFQQRFRQLWTTKSRERSSEKAELVQVDGHNDKHKGDEGEVVA